MPRNAPIVDRNRSCLFLTVVAALIFVLLGVAAIVYLPNNALLNVFSAQPSVPGKLGIIKQDGKDALGISEGSYAFDTNRSGGDLKRQGAEKFKSGDTVAAEALWHQAIQKDTNDAETYIYLENLKATARGNYVTLVVGTMLTGDDSALGSSRSTLQGAYIAQKEYNDGAKLAGKKLIRLLIANSGSKTDGATLVANQIVQLARQDKSIVGVMGWIYSSRTLAAREILAQAHIPMVSSTASADELTDKPFFFRVVSPNQDQALRGAAYAKDRLNAHKVALFVDPHDAYSNSLAEDFIREFATDSSHEVIKTQYTVGQRDALPGLLQTALQGNPDLIYFSGYSDDLATIMINLPDSFPNLRILGGDALYALNGYPSTARQNFHRLRFTSYFYPDQWEIAGLGSQKPGFFSSYIATFAPAFDPQTEQPHYGSSRADSDTALSYDATLALLKGCEQILTATKTTLTPDDLEQSLTRITGTNALPGASGQIAFGSNGDPVNKVVLILQVSPEGYIQMASSADMYGCLQVGQTGC